MTRDDFTTFLARAAADERVKLTEADAHSLVAKFDRGEIAENALSLPLFEAIPHPALIVNAQSVEENWAAMPPLTTPVNRLQDAFQQGVTDLAAALAASGDVTAWHRAMMEAITSHTLQQAMLGRRGRVPASDFVRLGTVIQTELAYLSRFADSVAVDVLRGSLEG